MLDVQLQRIEKWNGEYPTYLMQFGGSEDGPQLLVELPAVSPGK